MGRESRFAAHCSDDRPTHVRRNTHMIYPSSHDLFGNGLEFELAPATRAAAEMFVKGGSNGVAHAAIEHTPDPVPELNACHSIQPSCKGTSITQRFTVLRTGDQPPVARVIIQLFLEDLSPPMES